MLTCFTPSQSMRAALLAGLIASLCATSLAPAHASDVACAGSANSPAPSAAVPPSLSAAPSPAQLIVEAQRGRYDVPRVELAARLAIAGFTTSNEYARLRDNAARELAGRPDGAGAVSADELRLADAAIEHEIEILSGKSPPPSFAELARSRGRPQIAGLTIVYINPLGDPAKAHPWKNIIVHQTEGSPRSARGEAEAQFANPTKRGVTIWVETDGTVYWSVAENLVPTHGEGGDRNDNKYIDNSTTYHQVMKWNSIGVEFAGNFPDVRKPVTAAQTRAMLLLAPFLQERYGIPPQNIYAHNWIDYKDARYCEGCELATVIRKLGYCTSGVAR
jgi:hypothetical protein